MISLPRSRFIGAMWKRQRRSMKTQLIKRPTNCENFNTRPRTDMHRPPCIGSSWTRTTGQWSWRRRRFHLWILTLILARLMSGSFGRFGGYARRELKTAHNKPLEPTARYAAAQREAVG